MYPKIYLNPELVDETSVDELKEIVIDDWKKAHPESGAIILKNLEDSTKAKLICETGNDGDAEYRKTIYSYSFALEDCKYIDFI